jgi:hypothetical protein
MSDEDEELPYSPVMRKKAVKVKHVKRREKKFDKKVSWSEVVRNNGYNRDDNLLHTAYLNVKY